MSFLEISMEEVTSILHVIPSIDQGGAECTLSNIIRFAPQWEHHHVHTLTRLPNFFEIDPARVTTGTGQRGRFHPEIVWQLRKSIAELRPNVIHAWMYHANLASAVAAASGVPIIWSIHNDILLKEASKRGTRIVNRLCAGLSHIVPRRVVYVCEAVRETHERQGYAVGKGIVIPNGIDLARFDPTRFRQCRHPISDGRPVTVALIGRYEPVKGHHFFVDVVARHPARERIRLHFIGRECDQATDLRAHLARVGLLESAVLSDAITDIERVYAESDIVVVPSLAEALPLTVLEASA
ncbi:MAG: glycosyltransferase, partial [Alphaproteobacteria bacterium]